MVKESSLTNLELARPHSLRKQCAHTLTRCAWWGRKVPSCSARVWRAGHSLKRSRATRTALVATSPRLSWFHPRLSNR